MKGLHSHYLNKIISFSKSNLLCVGRTNKHVSPQKQLLTVSFNVIVGLLKYKYDFQWCIYIFSSRQFSMWQTTCIPQKMSPRGPALHLHQQIITTLLQKAETPYSSQDLCNIMDSVDSGMQISVQSLLVERIGYLSSKYLCKIFLKTS